ncbi:RNA polymerase sigma factor [Aquibacillus sediminis]|uniref:RNA polymerase sigma factor n=1 Tax=Aquibacillus sediminis TaxID=2574734 RepID=UPI001108B6AC|nr:RNA polymerase sigma factor [Aquibacillus sediminis]
MATNRKIISEWFHQYSNDIYNFLVYYTGTTDVEDLVQETFIKASKGLASYKNKSSPKTWLISIARNVAIDEARKKKNKIWKQTTAFDEQNGSFQSQGTTPEHTVLMNEDKQQLYNAIMQLKKNYRDVVILRGVKQFSIEETADILNWKQAKVRTTYHRALKSLRQQSGLEGDDL